MVKTRGFTLLELSICLALCALLAGMLLVRLAQYQRESQRVAAQGMVSAMRTAMAVRAAQLQGAGSGADLDALQRENPFLWLAELPKNYQGEYYRPRPGMVKEGNWYFDPSDRTVNFVQVRDTFSPEIPKLLNFKVELFREPNPNRTGERRESEPGIALAQIAGKAASTDH
ncbi:type II secretion system protein [uncultured Massilia sp.]|uniref:type II secretion system protein n=1 Tax=uncultured Massilia sp. TaxID=169973 RepID=UPI0025887274|nr:prepilin-type N-terminal cleavage/methylation domain-containing protein [uncultured Massilia sp.]